MHQQAHPPLTLHATTHRTILGMGRARIEGDRGLKLKGGKYGSNKAARYTVLPKFNYRGMLGLTRKEDKGAGLFTEAKMKEM